MPLFSRRINAQVDRYRYDIPELVRSRLLQTIRLGLQNLSSNKPSFEDVLAEMVDKLLQQYGALCRSQFQAAKMSDHPAIEHFFRCSDEQLIDFLELCFETRWHCGGQPLVEAINRVFEEENIGYELTEYSETVTQGGTFFGRIRPNIRTIIPTLPKALKKDERVLHSQVVKPCLQVLADSRFASADAELLEAFEEYRQAKYANAITDGGAAFESVLKIICDEKKWPYDRHKDTCSRLLEICQQNGLFHPFYRQILEGTATIRNKVGDAHGKGPNAQYSATQELADHMLYAVCNNINLVIRLASL